MNTEKKMVYYHNDLNEFIFPNFKKLHFDLFYSLIYLLKRKEEVSVSFHDLKELMTDGNPGKISDSDFKGLLAKTHDIVMSGIITTKTKDIIKSISIFKEFEVNFKEKTVTVKVNSDYVNLFVDFTSCFTKWDLQTFIGLKSRYSKTLFRLFTQYYTIGTLRLSYEDFRNILQIPEGYREDNIDQRVIKPALAELKTLPQFKKLSFKKEKSSNHGNPVVAYCFDNLRDSKQSKDVPVAEIFKAFDVEINEGDPDRLPFE